MTEEHEESLDGSYSLYSCLSCGRIMKDAVQLLCGCRLCKICAEKEVGSLRVFQCRYCEECVEASDGSMPYYKDTRIRKEIKSMAMSLPDMTQSTSPNEHPQKCSGKVEQSVDLRHELPPERDKKQNERDQKALKQLDLPHQDLVSKKSDIKIKARADNSCSDESFRKLISKSRENHKYKQTDFKALPEATKFSLGAVHEGATNAGHFPPQPQVFVSCGECGGQISIGTIKQHREQCRKLHLYNGMSFQVDQKSPSTTNHHSVPTSEGTLSTLREDNILQDIADGFRQPFHDVVSSLNQYTQKFKEDQMQRLKAYIHQKLLIDSPINDPIYQTMRWKVEHFSRRIREKHSILSRVFCSSHKGYNLRLCIDFHGGGHYWLRVVLVQGEHDSQLAWPFKPRVTVSILGEVALDVLEILNVRSVSRCTSETQGHVLCSLRFPEQLAHFLIDDCLFIRCMISS